MCNGSATWPLKRPDKIRWIFKNRILRNWSCLLKPIYRLKTLTCNVKRWSFVSGLAKSLKCALKWKLYRVSQKFVPLLYKSVTQCNWTWSAHNLNQSCDFRSNLIFHIYFLCQLLTWNSICVISRQRCAARVNFPAIYFLHFVARNARTLNLFYVNILKD